MNWLEEVIKQHDEFESPISFYYWGALAAISAVVKDQIWLPRYLYDLYPNIYVMFHADSGLKKGPAVSMASKLVKEVNNTNIISGRSSIQGILKSMGHSKTEPGGKVTHQGKVFICSSELTSSIVDDPVAVKILTDLYDRNYNVGSWRSLLKSETFDLKDPTVTMLTATNDAMSEDFFAKSAIQGGYFARTFIISEDTRNRPNSLLVPPVHVPNYKNSAMHLKTLANLKGPFQALGSREETDVHCIARKDRYTPSTFYYTKAGILYEDWYDNFISTIDTQEVKDDTGTLNRFGDSLLKVAMILSLTRSPTLVISEEAMIEAIFQCEKLIGNVRKATMGKRGMSDKSPLKMLVIKEMIARDNHQASRAMLMKKFWMHFATANEWDEMMEGFDASGMIKTRSQANTIIYEMPQEQAESMKLFFAGKNV